MMGLGFSFGSSHKTTGVKMPKKKQQRKQKGSATNRLETSSETFDTQCARAAKELSEADVLLIVTGAGFSADSGLAVYADVATIPAYEALGLEYSDICQPRWLHQNPELFYGFWGQSFNDYRKTKPHDGYRILQKWRRDILGRARETGLDEMIQTNLELKEQHASKEVYCSQMEIDCTPFKLPEGQRPGTFHVYTSNVDAHFYDYFGAHEIYECHGNIELWQCSGGDKCPSGIWRAPQNYHFEVDLTTMLAPELRDSGEKDLTHQKGTQDSPGTMIDSSIAHIGHTKGAPRCRGDTGGMLTGMPEATDDKGWSDCSSQNNWPRCGHCGKLARPAILMFGDMSWKYDNSQYQRWERWRQTVLDVCKKKRIHKGNETGVRVCIFEIGCGMRIQTCRYASAMMVEDVLSCGGNPSLVRINPDFPDAEKGSEEFDYTISLRSTGLKALRAIDKAYQMVRESRDYH